MFMTSEEKKKLEETTDKVNKIYEILVGDDELGRPGLIEEIKELREFKNQVMKLKWYSLGALGFAGLIYSIIKGIKEIILNN
jgi:hypothetical protein